MWTGPFVYILEMSWGYACASHQDAGGILRALLWLCISDNFRTEGVKNLETCTWCYMLQILTHCHLRHTDLRKRASLIKWSQELWRWTRLRYYARCSQCGLMQRCVPCAHSPPRQCHQLLQKACPLTFYSCFSEIGSPCVVHAGLKLLGSSNPPALASQFPPLQTIVAGYGGAHLYFQYSVGRARQIFIGWKPSWFT